MNAPPGPGAVWTPMESIPLPLCLAGFFMLAVGLAGLLADVWIARRWLKHPPDWRAAQAALWQRSWTWNDLAVLLLLLSGSRFLLITTQTVAEALQLAWARSMGLWLVASSVGFHGLGLCIIAMVWWRRRKERPVFFGLRTAAWSRWLATGLFLYVAMMPIIWFYTMVYQLGLRAMGISPTLQEAVLLFTSATPMWMRIYMLLLGVVVAPVVEEMLFRGILLPTLGRRIGLLPAVVATSLLFAAMHMHLGSFFSLFLLALAFSGAYLLTRSLLTPMIMHATFNAVSLGLLLIFSPYFPAN